MTKNTTLLVICIHKRVKSFVFAVSIKFCDESGLAIFSIWQWKNIWAFCLLFIVLIVWRPDERRRMNPPIKTNFGGPFCQHQPTSGEHCPLLYCKSSTDSLLPPLVGKSYFLTIQIQTTSTPPPASATSTSVSSSDIIQPSTQPSLLLEITVSGTIYSAILEVPSPSTLFPYHLLQLC